MQESLGIEMAKGLKTDERPMFLLKVAFDFLVCSLKKKTLSLDSRGCECGLKADPCSSAQEKQPIMVETLWSGVHWIGRGAHLFQDLGRYQIKLLIYNIGRSAFEMCRCVG